MSVPRTKNEGRRLTEVVITEAHETIGHMGAQKTDKYARRWYW